MKFKAFSGIAAAIFFCQALTAQQHKMVTVNYATGTANVSIPLYTVSSGSVQVPLSLDYAAIGVRTTDAEGTAGVGWNLNAGGAVTRMVRGLPDDCTKDITGAVKHGWMTSGNNATSLISGFNIEAGAINSTSCYFEKFDISYINSNFPANLDTQPDIFNVEAPGLSCQLVFDQVSQQFKTIPYTDLKISYATGSNGITSFSITTDQGITYVFSAAEPSFERATSNNNASPPYFAATYNAYQGSFSYTPGQQYQYYVADGEGYPFLANGSTQGYWTYAGGISFTGAWDLTSMTDVYGNFVSFSYVAGTKKGYISPVSYFSGSSSTPVNTYIITGNSTPNLISQINYGNSRSTQTAFNLTWNYNGHTQKSFVSTITGFGRNFDFNYNEITSGTLSRFFLNNVVDPGCGTPFNFAFSYINPQALPDSTSANVDYWGFYNTIDIAEPPAGNTSLRPDIKINPSSTSYPMLANPESIIKPAGGSPSSAYTAAYQYEIAGSNRKPAPIDPAAGYSPNSIGTLSQIYYGNGGVTSLSYEPNDYYDPGIGGTVLGGGIRVTAISDVELIQANTTVGPPITTYFTYSDPTTGFSTGQPVSLPVFAFITPDAYDSGAQLSINSVISSYSDLSQEDHTIYYGSVTESMVGTGSVVHQFLLPAMNGTPTSTPLYWSPTTVYIGRNQNPNYSCPNIGLLNTGTNIYPFPPNPNFSFERGLPLKTVNYNTVGDLQTANEVSETDYTYSSPTPYNITGFAFDYNSQTGTQATTTYAYAKYGINTTTGPLITSENYKVFDLNSTTASKQTATTYAYASAYHQKPTAISTTTSDGSTRVENIRYSKDYNVPGTITPGDNFTAGLQFLGNNNINIPIENYVQYTPPGTNQTTVVTNGSLVNFGMFTNPFNTSLKFGAPAQKRGLFSAAGVTGFVPSSVSGSYTFVSDPNYQTIENELAYNYNGTILSKDDGFTHVSSQIVNHLSGKPEIQINNTKISEIMFDDFDANSDNPYIPLINAGTSQAAQIISGVAGRNGAGLQIGAGVTFNQTISRNVNAKKYIFSFWVNAATPGTMTVTVTGTGTSGPITNSGSINYNTTTVPNTTTGWQYWEIPVSMSGITSSTIAVSAGTSQTASVDDIIFYPEAAEATLFSYDPVTNLPAAKTMPNGFAQYYKFDPYGRMTYQFDQDKNIVKRNIYTSASNIESQIGSTANGGFVIPITFTTSLSSRTVTCANGTFATPCQPGPGFSWTFGDGTSTTSTANASVQHTYTAAGTYTITLTLSNSMALPYTRTIVVK